jgi:hypothetical protein
MAYVNSNETLTTKPLKITFVIIALVVYFAFDFLLVPSFHQARSHLNQIYNQKHSFPLVYNLTHLWSMRFIDKNYLRLARLLPY